MECGWNIENISCTSKIDPCTSTYLNLFNTTTLLLDMRSIMCYGAVENQVHHWVFNVNTPNKMERFWISEMAWKTEPQNGVEDCVHT